MNTYAGVCPYCGNEDIDDECCCEKTETITVYTDLACNTKDIKIKKEQWI